MLSVPVRDIPAPITRIPSSEDGVETAAAARMTWSYSFAAVNWSMSWPSSQDIGFSRLHDPVRSRPAGGPASCIFALTTVIACRAKTAARESGRRRRVAGKLALLICYPARRRNGSVSRNKIEAIQARQQRFARYAAIILVPQDIDHDLALVLQAECA